MYTKDLQPLDLISNDPVDQTLFEVSASLPRWLSGATESVRDEYGRQLVAYHASARALETHLQQVLPSFEEYVRTQMGSRIRNELGLELDPDVVMIDLPERVWRDYDIDPQFGRVTNYAAPWVASVEREQLSLSELARRNFRRDDEQMARRLDFAVISMDEPQTAPGLTGIWLQHAIPALDVAHGYLTLLEEVFGVPSMASEQGLRDADRLLEPYERQIMLLGICERARRRLSEEGYQMLMLAAQARSRAETDALHLQMNWLQFKPGTSVSGEDASHTLSGACMIRHQHTNRTLIYLPDAPADLGLIEAPDPVVARARLIQELVSQPALIAYLAERTLDSANLARHVSYINQALARGFDGFLRFVPAHDLQLAAQALHCRAWILHRKVRARARTRFDLAREADKQQNETLLMYFRAMLAFLPGIGTAISLQDGWNDGHTAAQAFAQGRRDDGLLAVGAAALSVLDVVFSVVPGVATIRVLTKAANRGLRAGATAAAGKYLITPFEGYEVHKSLAGALAQSGPDIGTLKKDGQLWIQRENQVYAVYRRAGEQTLRLKKTAAHGYEPPVMLENGAWVYHSNVGLKGGVRSTIAETVIANAHNDPAFTRRQARELLDQFVFPPDRQRRMELDVAIHFQRHQVVPNWAEAYRRQDELPVPVAAARAGSGATKRKDVPVSDNATKRPADPDPAVLPGPSEGRDSWKRWARTLADPESFTQVSVQPPIFRAVNGRGDDFIQIQGARYDILPHGTTEHPSIVFLKSPGLVDESVAGLNEIIVRRHYDQPLMVAFADGNWTVHGPLFKRPIAQLVEQARPGMTPASYRVLAEKLFESGDVTHAGLTSSRLLALRATLNAWQRGEAAPLAHLNDPLLMLEGSYMTRVGTVNPGISLSYGPSLQSFKRLDFEVSEASLAALLATAKSESRAGVAGRKALRDLMSAVMTRTGYSLVSEGSAALEFRSVLLFQRAQQRELYMLNMRRFTEATPTLPVSSADSPVAMSNRWVDEMVGQISQQATRDQVMQARDQGKLVKLMGGIKITSGAQGGTQVFVQRIADDF